MSKDGSSRHWHKEPADSTHRYVAAAPFAPTEKGLQAAIEIIAYPKDHVQVVVSRITGKPGNRKITQTPYPLMFNDIEEAKDAIDLILDRLADEARRAGKSA